MAENISGKDVTFDIVINAGTEAHARAFSLAQEALIQSFKSAGDDVAGLAARLGVPIAYLTVTTAKVATVYGYDAIKITIAINSGDPVKVLAEVTGAGMGLASGYVSGLFFGAVVSPFVTPAVGTVVGVGAGIFTAAVVGEATKTSVTNFLNGDQSAEWGGAIIGALDMATKLTVGTPSAFTAIDLPPANLAPSSALVFDPIDQQAKVIFNNSTTHVIDPDVPSDPNNYIVQPGDSLWKIAQTNGWDFDALKAANSQLTDPNFIRPNQVINGLAPVVPDNTFSLTNTNPATPLDPGAAPEYSPLGSGGILYQAGGVTVTLPENLVDSTSTGNLASTTLAGLTAGDIRPGALGPIYDNAVTQAGDFLGSLLAPTDFNMITVGASLNNGYNGGALSIYVDPLVLDLNGDGVTLTSYGTAPVLFDIDHDGGSKEQAGWVSSQDGIVVYDLNNNGQIDNISETLSEYFNGTVGTNGNAGTKPYAHGLAALKSLDSNNDNVFNNLDTAWSNVKVWVDDDHNGISFKDTNANGVLEAGEVSELKTLTELGITSINLTSTSQSGLVRDGNEVLATGSFTQNIDAAGQGVPVGTIGSSSVTREAIAANFPWMAQRMTQNTLSTLFWRLDGSGLRDLSDGQRAGLGN